ncbi:hypothetical protein PCA20602_03085 [Pandoraea capi]|uniref:Uncharacterized protein n=1 Tax=Pandoraea capi TaxID=2508286 RepID=A0ABY6W2V9_9BURK|nr:hypothetical protein [Pandoraea capi]VVE19897.1 hypothetical protein PCA20602_03085 [Pandoraea capi]
MPTTPITQPSSSTNFQVQGYPDQMLSERRLSELSDFNRLMNLGGKIPDSTISGFLARFRSMGVLDTVSNTLSGTEKARILAGAAHCHVASFGQGRDYLERHSPHRPVNDDAANQLAELTSSVRDNVMATAGIGEDGLIVFTFPDVPLHFPLTMSSLGTGDKALLRHEARQLLLKPDGNESSLLAALVKRMANPQPRDFNAEVCEVWIALIERGLSDDEPAAFSDDQIEIHMLGSALMALARRLEEVPNADTSRLLWMLTTGADAFAKSQDTKSHGVALMRVADFHKGRGERDKATAANTFAASVLAKTALQRLEDGNVEDANHCARLSKEARILAGTLDFEVEQHSPPLDVNFGYDDAYSLSQLSDFVSQRRFDEKWESLNESTQAQSSSWLDKFPRVNSGDVESEGSISDGDGESKVEETDLGFKSDDSH